MKTGTIENHWFHEIDTMWPGISLGLKVKKTLYTGKSQYQDIQVFESEAYGNVLILDGVIQITERDEYTYQEMLAHTPLNIVENPKKVLVIGGGDGGMIREVLRYDSIENVTMCEIDEEVVNVSKDFLPTISTGFSDPRTNLVIGDGAEFVKNTKDIYDVIIVDSSDPIGPAESLFVEQFYQDLKNILSPHGAIAIQGESLFLHNDLAKELKTNMYKLFEYAEYAIVQVPTYPAGSIGLLVCSDTHSPKSPVAEMPSNIQKHLKYYSPEMHRASFVLPYCCKDL